MRHPLLAALVTVAALAAPAPAQAWGAAAHRYIMRRAIDLLPLELKPFFSAQAQELVLRVNDPDLWRTAGWEDDPNHFLDFGAPEYGAYPFAALPSDYDAAVAKFGTATIKRLGMLPWRAGEEFGNLRRAFEGFSKGYQYAPGDTILFAAVAAHYVQDARQPLHGTNNYDGQLTGQWGIHARFESALFERFEARLTVSPNLAAPIAAARDHEFEVLRQSYTLVDPILAADKHAVAGKQIYDDEYFEQFFAGVKTLLEQQLAASISDTVGMITGAWEAAGKPTPVSRLPRTPQKVRG